MDHEVHQLSNDTRGKGAGDAARRGYSNDDCPYCRYAKRLLDGRGIAYEEIELATDDAGRTRLAALSGRLSLPQIVVDGEPIGGFAALGQLIRDGRLSPAPDDGVERTA